MQCASFLSLHFRVSLFSILHEEFNRKTTPILEYKFYEDDNLNLTFVQLLRGFRIFVLLDRLVCLINGGIIRNGTLFLIKLLDPCVVLSLALFTYCWLFNSLASTSNSAANCTIYK